ncbi:DUF4148 domain-containing protein [Orrella sp. JC864]|uniref:DUF4148 domain-containing protein n=1 Tax=Orrella sp. JC864 TaxID=3120298 RepID=UPI00300BBFDE
MTKTLKLFPGLALGLALNAGTLQAQELTAEPRPPASAKSRAEVRAETAAWRQAGLAQAWRGEQTPDIEGPQYRAGVERYAQAADRLRAQSGEGARALAYAPRKAR